MPRPDSASAESSEAWAKTLCRASAKERLLAMSLINEWLNEIVTGINEVSK